MNEKIKIGDISIEQGTDEYLDFLKFITNKAEKYMKCKK